MSYSAITQPDKYMGAYSAVPLKVYDTDWDVSENFKYIVNICWDEENINNEIGYILGNDVYTKLTSATPHNYSLGDYLFLDDTLNNNQYTGYYIIKKIVSSTEFVIDLTIGEPFGSSAYTTSKFIKYKFNPDLDGYAKVDLGNVLKDFVSQNLTGQSVDYKLKYNAPDTKFDYKLVCGSEKRYRLEFEDNHFTTGGTIGFNNTTITSLTGIPFQVGDEIFVQQDIYGWVYIDNTYTGTYIGFTGATNVPFDIGTNITVVGQITNPSYNGQTVVDGIPSAKVLRTQKLFVSNTPVEGGVIYGVPVPSYNGVATITSIYIDPTFGLVIQTDKPFIKNTPPIPGYIEFADNRLTTIPNQITISGLSAYNAHLNLNEYTLTEFDKYVIQDRNFDENYLSTIMNDKQKYRVEPNTIGFILLHQGEDSLAQGVGYSFYNSSNTLLGNLLFTGTTDDMYCPIGLEQISGMSGANNFGIPYSSYSQNINSYCMYAADDCKFCKCLTGNIKFKPGSGSTYSVNLSSNGTLNGRDYWDWTMSATTGNVPVRLWWVNDGVSFKWYITPQSNTTHNPFYLYDKDYNTDCPGDTLEWSSPVGSPLSGFSTGTLFVENPSGGITQYSNEVCFELNKDCSQYEIYHLIWKDKLGSLISYPFIYISRDNMEAERKNYYRQNGSWENNTFGYNDYERGEKDFYVRSRKSIIVNSGWLYEFERDLMEDLIQSPSVYLQTPDNRLYGGRLEEKKIEVYKQKNEDIFSYSFNFIFSNNEYRF